MKFRHDTVRREPHTTPCGDVLAGPSPRKMLSKYLPDVTSAIYYLTGPPGMVKALRAVLTTAGIDDDDIRTEELTGY